MTRNECTPSPWVIDDAYATDVVNADGYSVCSCDYTADARLIAAAPDMLAALKAVMAGFESGVLCRNTDNDGGSDWAIKAMPALAALAAAARAIEKAEGREVTV